MLEVKSIVSCTTNIVIRHADLDGKQSEVLA